MEESTEKSKENKWKHLRMNVNMEFVIDTLKVETVILVTNVIQNCDVDVRRKTLLTYSL